MSLKIEEIASVLRLSRYLPIEEANYCINISTKHGFVYFENPKVACGTIKRTLQSIEAGSSVNPLNVHDRGESPLQEIENFDEDHISQILWGREFFKFSFVRNPFTRALSVYKDKIERDSKHKKSVLKILGKETENLRQNVSFKEFLYAVSQQSQVEMDNHWRPQNIQLCMPLINFDFIGRFENFDNDFKKVLHTISPILQNQIVYEKSNATHANQFLLNYYDSEATDLVRLIYKDDFEIFGYELDV